MLLFSFALYVFLSNDERLVLWEGGVLFAALLVFLVILIKKANNDADLDEVDDTLAVVSYFKITLWLIIGGAALYFGSEWLVDGAVVLAEQLGVSKAVISVSMIAIGTSVPELAASVIAAAKKEKAISLGNLIGSNIFNIGSVLGLTSMIKTIPVTDAQILSRDIFWMLAFAAVYYHLHYYQKNIKLADLRGFF